MAGLLPPVPTARRRALALHRLHPGQGDRVDGFGLAVVVAVASERHEDPVVGDVGVQDLGGEPGVGRRGALDLLGQVVVAGHAEVGSEGGGELDGDHPVRPGKPGRRDLGPEAADPPLDVGRRTRPLVRHRARQDDVGVEVDRFGRVPRHRDDEVPRRERLLRHGVVGEVAQRVRAEQDQRAHLCATVTLTRPLAGHGGEDVRRREPGRRGHRTPGGAETLPPRIEADRARAGGPGRAPCRGHRRRSRGAARAGRSPGAARRPGRAAPRRRPRRTRRRRAGPPRPRRPPRRGASRAGGGPHRAAAAETAAPWWWVPSAVAAASSPVSARAISGASPGRMARLAAASGVREVGTGVISTSARSAPTTASRRRRKRTGNSSRKSPANVTRSSARHASSMVARGRPSTRSAGSPSPSWASTESVPTTPLASLAQA